MTPNEFLERLAGVEVHRAHGRRAPHKPLMLLLALGRVHSDTDRRLISYTAAEALFTKLWEDFGRPGGDPNPHYPFGRLRNDDRLWEIPEESLLSTSRREDIGIGEARELGITGGFRRDVHDLL